MSKSQRDSEKVVETVTAEKSLAAGRIGKVIFEAGTKASPLEPPKPVQKPPRNLPPRNDKFVGRGTELDEIHQRLSNAGEIGVTQQTAAHGLGGIGKTSIAIEYAWKHLDDYPGGVFIVLCDRDLLLPEIVNLASSLGMEESDNPEQTAERVKQRLETGEPSLLILDNVRGAAQFGDSQWSSLLPTGNCRRLITTRAGNLGPSVPMYAVERLPKEQGIDLIAQFRKDAADDDNREIVGDIVDWFDGLAVGLTLVGVYMSLKETLSWGAYKKSLDDKGLGAVRQSRDIVDAEAGGLPERYEERIDAVFDDAVDALDPPHVRALDYAALMPEDTVLKHWLTWLVENDDAIELPETPGFESDPATPIVDELVRLRLLRPLEGERDTLSLHRLLRRRRVEHLADDSDLRNQLLDRLVALAEFRGEASHDAVTDKSLRTELTPLLRLTDVFLEHDRPAAAARLALWVNTPLDALARHEENRVSLSRFMRDGVCSLESDDPAEAATLLSNLAITLQSLGDLPGAKRQMERAIEIDEKHFDPDHPTLAVSYSNLATILKDLDDLPGAKSQMERAIEIEEKHFEPDHPTLAVSYSNLAMILKNLGDLPGAKRRIERAIAIKEKLFDPDHPTMAVSYSNLATILQRLGDLPAAKHQIERSIEIEEKHFDPDHPTLAISYNNLAHIELESGNKPEACDLWRRAYRIVTKHFDAEHPHVQLIRKFLEAHCGGIPDECPAS